MGPELAELHGSMHLSSISLFGLSVSPPFRFGFWSGLSGFVTFMFGVIFISFHFNFCH